jgi:hypothetical protein
MDQISKIILFQNNFSTSGSIDIEIDYCKQQNSVQRDEAKLAKSNLLAGIRRES